FIKSGNIPPRPTTARWNLLHRLARLFIFLQVGRVRIIGRENLNLEDGPTIIGGNHSHWIDPAMVAALVDRTGWFMAGKESLQMCRGWLAPFFGSMGAFPVDTEKGRGGSARCVAEQVLSQGGPLVMFPHSVRLHGKPQPFKKGIPGILKAVQKQTGV